MPKRWINFCGVSYPPTALVVEVVRFPFVLVVDVNLDETLA